MIINGTVVKSADKIAYVKIQRQKECEDCVNKHDCMKNDFEMRALNTIGAKSGDIVELEKTDDNKSIFLIGYIFMVPIIILFTAIFISYINIILAVIIGVSAVIAWLVILLKLNKTYKTKTSIISIIDSEINDIL